MSFLHIGIDDTDSTTRGCTTYIAALLVEKLEKMGAKFIDYPNLVRLNPNVPWKTRGNGALCLRIQHDKNLRHSIKEETISTVEEQSELENRGTDPGIVFLNRRTPPKEIQFFAKKVEQDVVNIQDAMELVKRHGLDALAFKEGRGIVGALAAIGETLRSDHTYEIIAYRKPENRGTIRKVDQSSIFEMDTATRPYTFNNVDTEKGRVIITPRGPDPILFGIRGEKAETVKKAFEMVKICEPVERWVIFRTNQGTDAHLRPVEKISKVEPHNPVIVNGVVSKAPWMIRGRHAIFRIRDETAEIDCAAYEPTGNLRITAMKLIVGDRVRVCGGVRPASRDNPLTINLEKLEVVKPLQLVAYQNPICRNCGKRLKSMGTNKGFRCDRCGSRYVSLKKISVRMGRDIGKGLYVTASRSQRHLTKPLVRYGLEKVGCDVDLMIERWHSA